MKIKLIAIDVDGTLVGHSLSLSSYSKEVLKKAIKQGYKIVLSSGRPYRSLIPFYEAIDCFDPLIAYNGSLILNPRDSRFPIYRKSFESSSIKALAKEVKPHCFVAFSESGHTLYKSHEDAFLDGYFPAADIKCLLGPLEENIHENVYTFIMGHKDEETEAIKKIVESHSGIGYRHWSKCPYSEIYPLGVDKGTALRLLMKEMNLAKDEVMAFGDSGNDYEMMLEAGKAYAMKDCKSDFLASKFPPTLDTAENDGLAKTLSKLLNLD